MRFALLFLTGALALTGTRAQAGGHFTTQDILDLTGTARPASDDEGPRVGIVQKKKDAGSAVITPANQAAFILWYKMYKQRGKLDPETFTDPRIVTNDDIREMKEELHRALFPESEKYDASKTTIRLERGSVLIYFRPNGPVYRYTPE
jgi:hypothetical protein